MRVTSMIDANEFNALKQNIFFYILQPAIMMFSTIVLLLNAHNDAFGISAQFSTLGIAIIAHIIKMHFCTKHKSKFLSLQRQVAEVTIFSVFVISSVLISLFSILITATDYNAMVLFYVKCLYFVYALFSMVIIAMSAQRMFYMYTIFDKYNKTTMIENSDIPLINSITQLITKEDEKRIRVAHSGVYATVSCVVYCLASLMSGYNTVGYYIFALPIAVVALAMIIINTVAVSLNKHYFKKPLLCYISTVLNIAICFMGLFFNDVSIKIMDGAVVAYTFNMFSFVFVIILAILPMYIYCKTYPNIFGKVRKIDKMPELDF